METVRFNAFHQVHQALRALLYHTALAVQHTDFTNQEEVNETVAKIEEVLWLFEGHADIEDNAVFPLVSDIAADVIADFEQQHEKDHALGEALANSLQIFKIAITPAEKKLAGKLIQTALTEFVAFNLSHMNLEEQKVLPLLQQKFTDEALKENIMKVVATIPQEKNVRYNYWMLKGLSFGEIVAWYEEIRAAAPPFVFNGFVELAEKAMTPSKFTRLIQQLGVEEVLTV